MSQKQFSVRLFVDQDLKKDLGVALDKPQAHYVATVMRHQAGDRVVLFNGRDGEWLGEIQEARKQTVLIHVQEQLRPQPEAMDLQLWFAPVKKIQNGLIVQKATELGVSALVPVQTQRTNADRLRTDKAYLQAIEAAEQSERLTVPEVREPVRLDTMLKALEPDRQLLFCHERLDGASALEVLQRQGRAQKWAVLVGPEGGFTDEERELIQSCEQAHAISLGPRILRAETAVIASLSLLQAVCGDWN
ncbi:16S rRNA (uracil(1498)-N(3))-methyltransferase [Sneathiella chinensis]|uniref:Ribosomal RNA small subunit methyltransferase E n=1 Tax=Sneathiella chinensis TaxID=349750 RepID=A0ABQ5U301_9PROT|nr:16S rRNA (uracil(1498)-N(3))-methyltransferase [Sneathiella chinensis]GLQ05664.1 ribosomal RNA small subunit methyltransferase E [Sneathiella chinensis]